MWNLLPLEPNNPSKHCASFSVIRHQHVGIYFLLCRGYIRVPLTVCVCVCVCVRVWVTQSCPSLGDLMDCSLPGCPVHGILQARILEWVATPFSRDLTNPGIKPRSPALQADSLPTELWGKPLRESRHNKQLITILAIIGIITHVTIAIYLSDSSMHTKNTKGLFWDSVLGAWTHIKSNSDTRLTSSEICQTSNLAGHTHLRSSF